MVDIAASDGSEQIARSLSIGGVARESQAFAVFLEAERSALGTSQNDVLVMIHKAADVLVLFERARKGAWLDDLAEIAKVRRFVEDGGVAVDARLG